MKTDITKEDWEVARTQYESLIVNGKINAQIHKVALKYAEKELAKFKDTDEMPEDMKDVVEEITK